MQFLCVPAFHDVYAPILKAVKKCYEKCECKMYSSWVSKKKKKKTTKNTIYIYFFFSCNHSKLLAARQVLAQKNFGSHQRYSTLCLSLQLDCTNGPLRPRPMTAELWGSKGKIQYQKPLVHIR